MILVGAGGHAKEVYDILSTQEDIKNIVFFEEPAYNTKDLFVNKFQVIRNLDDIEYLFKTDNRYALAVGNPRTRHRLNLLFQKLGGKLISIISDTAIVSKINVSLKDGLNIMHRVIIGPSVNVGYSTLINAGSIIHHDVTIGDNTEINPGVILTGNVNVNDFCSIGAGSVVLPGIKIGSNSIIGAGAVVNKDIPANSIAIGVPAKIIKKNQHLTLTE